MIRENNIVVVVGETGSGKTTQLTQVKIVLYLEFTLYILIIVLKGCHNHIYSCTTTSTQEVTATQETKFSRDLAAFALEFLEMLFQ